MDSSLTVGEKRKLATHEETITLGVNSWLAMGKALAAIKNEKLYTDVADTFDAYIDIQWRFTVRRAQQLIASYLATDNVRTIGSHPPDNERQARELSKVDGQENQATVWAKAVESAPRGKVTAAHVAKVAKEVAAPAEPDDPPAPESTPGPDIEALSAPYTRAVNDLNRIRREFVELSSQQGTGAYLNLVVGRITKGLDDAKSPIAQNMPVAVCDKCDGDGCGGCSATGFLTKGVQEARK